MPHYIKKLPKKQVELIKTICTFIYNRQLSNVDTSQAIIMKQYNISRDKLEETIKEIKNRYETFTEFKLRGDRREKYYKFAGIETRSTDYYNNLIELITTPSSEDFPQFPLKDALATDFILFLNSPFQSIDEKISILYQMERYLPSTAFLRNFYKSNPNFISDYLKASQQDQKETLI